MEEEPAEFKETNWRLVFVGILMILFGIFVFLAGTYIMILVEYSILVSITIVILGFVVIAINLGHSKTVETDFEHDPDWLEKED